jgi:hypothetical protein
VVCYRTFRTQRAMFVPAGTAMSPTLKLLVTRRKRNRIGLLCRNTSCANAIATALLDTTCEKKVLNCFNIYSFKNSNTCMLITSPCARPCGHTYLNRIARFVGAQGPFADTKNLFARRQHMKIQLCSSKKDTCFKQLIQAPPDN